MLCLKILTPYKHRLSEPCRIKNCGSREEQASNNFKLKELDQSQEHILGYTALVQMLK